MKERGPATETPCPACGAEHPFFLSITKGPEWEETALRCPSCGTTYVIERDGDVEKVSSDYVPPPKTINNAAMDEFVALYDKMRGHARTCVRCTVPVLDAEGNPGMIFDACPEGAALIREYQRLEPTIEVDAGEGVSHLTLIRKRGDLNAKGQRWVPKSFSTRGAADEYARDHGLNPESVHRGRFGWEVPGAGNWSASTEEQEAIRRGNAPDDPSKVS